MSSNSHHRIDWNVRYRADLCRHYIDSCKAIFGISEFSPIKNTLAYSLLEEYGKEFGFAKLKDGLDNYFRWCKQKGYIPTWRGALDSAKTHIQLNEQKEFEKAEKKNHAEEVRRLKINQRKREAVQQYGKPVTTEEIRKCWDYVDSYKLLYESERRDLIAQNYLTDIPADDKWRMKNLEKYKPGFKSLGDILNTAAETAKPINNKEGKTDGAT